MKMLKNIIKILERSSYINLPRSIIGEGSVIGAGSVVKGEIPPYCLAVGSPKSCKDI